MAKRLKFYGWGYENTGLTDAEREHLFRFVVNHLGVEPVAAPPPQASDIALRAPRVAAPPSLAHVLTSEPYERLLHTYGKSYPETVRALARDFANAPDLVALPATEAEVAAALDWAGGAKVAVIPFGGGSSVVGGVEPAVGDGYAGAVSLDMRRFGQVLEVDATSRAARIQSGIRGPAIEAALKPHGFALRHYPQSFEFSTLGGWIATRSGGHFATLYTHIDDLVESLRTISPAGAMESRRLPGSGAGPSPDRMMIGSEGALGVITEAWMRLQGRPRFRGDAVFGFPDFFAAARAVRAVAQAGLYPSNLRVIDNDEAGAYGVNAYEESLLVLAFESADHPVDAWMARAVELMQNSGGRRHVDEGAASRWRTAFIRMPYGRELTVPMGVINDTFETAITWDKFEAFHGAVRKATEEALKEATGHAGTLSTRFTHVYPDGPAVYYTFNVRGDPTRLIEQWTHIKTRASDALIAAGGTITHHHAVGRDHMPWYRAQRPDLFGKALAAAKHALDPAGIMNPGVIVP
ncbi:MAG: FAD-binding oxidoreductase [Hyphomicrobiales bacterium]|nr:FAD-binding oxidoreductase [Hyphomicrobiales bacterium]